jgi:putative flippase GtrA
VKLPLGSLFDAVFLKFILVGIVNTLTGSLIMFILYNAAGWNYWLSSGCNYFFTSILSFFLNKYFTFREKQWSLFQVVSFVLTIVISYFLAYGISKSLSYRLIGKTGYSIKFQENISLLTGMIFFTALNYFGQRIVVFKRTDEQR